MDEKKLMEKEWDLSWEHIKNVRYTYWTLFLSIVAFNGLILNYYFNPDRIYEIKELGISIFLLIINSLILLIYQREHFAQEENLITIYRIRKEILKEKNESNKWNYLFQNEKTLLKGHGYKLYVILKCIIGISAPLFILFNFFINNSIDTVSIVLSSIFVVILVFVVSRFSYVQCKNNCELKKLRDEF